MWNLDNISFRRPTEEMIASRSDLKPGDQLRLQATMTFGNGETTRSTFALVSTRSEVDNIVKEKLAQLNEQQDLQDNADTYEPAPEEVLTRVQETKQDLDNAVNDLEYLEGLQAKIDPQGNDSGLNNSIQQLKNQIPNMITEWQNAQRNS